jgi:hypothetical protein
MRIHIHANCQAIPLAGMLNEAYPDWEISFFEAHAQPIIDQLDRYYEWVRTADVVLAQPIHDGFRGRDDLSLSWVRANIRPGGSLIVFPSMHFGAHQASWEMNPSPGFDLLAAHLVASGLQPADALRHLLSTDLLSDADIEREIEAAILETKRREIEDEMDVKISPFLEEHSRTRMLFHINNHPMRETAVFIANAILERMGFPRRVLVEGHDYQPNPHVAPLPAITRFLASRSGIMPDPGLYDTVLLHGIPGTPISVYYSQMIERLALVPAAELFASIAGRWPTIQVLRRLAAHNSAIPDIERWVS